MHGRTCRIHGVEDDKIARAVVAAFKTNDAEGVARLLEVNGR